MVRMVADDAQRAIELFAEQQPGQGMRQRETGQADGLVGLPLQGLVDAIGAADDESRRTTGTHPVFETLGEIVEPMYVQFTTPDEVTGSGYAAATNGGSNWNTQVSGVNAVLTSVYFASVNTGYIVGDSGKIFKTTNGGISIGIIQISSEIPEKFSLSQNYPNPFNPQTKIKFDVPANVKGQTSNVKLVIYDLLGREVTTLVNEELKPGTYEADWDGSNFSSGVYFYKIISGDFVETKKMVLMK